MQLQAAHVAVQAKTTRTARYQMTRACNAQGRMDLSLLLRLWVNIDKCISADDCLCLAAAGLIKI